MATNPVKVEYKQPGSYIEWEQRGATLSFDDDALCLKPAKYQMDEARTVDICEDRQGCLVIGAASGIRYVAQVEIPAAEYEEVTTGEGEEQTTERVKKPLDMGDVTLVLWAIDN
jgi:hypothetical protein